MSEALRDDAVSTLMVELRNRGMLAQVGYWTDKPGKTLLVKTPDGGTGNVPSRWKGFRVRVIGKIETHAA